MQAQSQLDSASSFHCLIMHRQPKTFLKSTSASSSTNALNCRRPTQFCERQSADDQCNQLSTIQQLLLKKLLKNCSVILLLVIFIIKSFQNLVRIIFVVGQCQLRLINYLFGVLSQCACFFIPPMALQLSPQDKYF